MSSSLRYETTGEILTIHLTDAKILDETIIQQISTEVVELLGKTKEENVLIDFSHVRFMSSAALGMLMRVHKKCKEFKINLKLCEIHPDILQVFKITRLDKVLSICPDAATALEAFKKKGLFFRS